MVTDVCAPVSVIKSQYFDRIKIRFTGLVMSEIKSLVIVTDAWFPQVNGVVRTLSTTKAELEKKGYRVAVISPEGYRSVPCPTYPEIRLALFASKAVGKRLSSLRPDAVHIATEGPLGLAARRWCKKNRFPFTTSYHTRFPEYVRLRAPIPISWSYTFLRWFHEPAHRMLVATQSMENELLARGFKNIGRWSRGVDLELFTHDSQHQRSKSPILLYVGRVAPEKNVGAFLELGCIGTKRVVGGGPELEALIQKYPEVEFLGYKHGPELALEIRQADCFVFPSRTDTFGLVILEALASGVPVAAYPAPGPLDLIENGHNGWVSEDLNHAINEALKVNREACRKFAERFSWENCTAQFISQLRPIEANKLQKTL